MYFTCDFMHLFYIEIYIHENFPFLSLCPNFPTSINSIPSLPMLLEGAGALPHRIDQSTSNILIELEATARGIHLSIHHPEAEDLSSMMEI